MSKAGFDKLKMKIETKISQKSEPSPEDWEQLRARLIALGVAHEKFVREVPGYRKGDSIYEHFYRDGVQTLNVILEGRANSLSSVEAHRTCSEILAQLERYHRLLESNSMFTQRECSQMPVPRLRELKSYLDGEEAELRKV